MSNTDRRIPAHAQFFTIRIDTELLETLRLVAVREERSIGAIVRSAIKSHLEEMQRGLHRD